MQETATKDKGLSGARQNVIPGAAQQSINDYEKRSKSRPKESKEKKETLYGTLREIPPG